MSHEIQHKRRRSRNVDFGLAAVCFAGFLEVFSLGTNQTPTTIIAANHFAISIPLLVGSSLLASLILGQAEERRNRWSTVTVLVLDLVGVAGTVGGVLGIYFMFKAVSPEAGTNFVYFSLGLLALSVVALKIDLIIQFASRKNDA